MKVCIHIQPQFQITRFLKLVIGCLEKQVTKHWNTKVNTHVIAQL